MNTRLAFRVGGRLQAILPLQRILIDKVENFNILRYTQKVILNFCLRLLVLCISRKVWASEYSLLQGFFY